MASDRAGADTGEVIESRLAARADALAIPVERAWLSRLAAYYALLSRWNRRINLTSLPLEGCPPEALDRLLLEPIAATRHLEAPQTWFDLGSGGGSPAIPMKLVFPAAHLTLVESRSRKAAFLREAIRLLALDAAMVENSRVEDLRGSRASVDLITARGIKLDARVRRKIVELLSPAGRLVVFGADTLRPVKMSSLVLEDVHALPILPVSIQIFSRRDQAAS